MRRAERSAARRTDRTPRRARTAVGVVAATVLTAFLALPAALAATADETVPPTAGLSYVALGDSYAAGLGLEPATGAPVPGCGQSATDYPHLVAERLGLELTDVSCAGATTANILDTPQATPAGTAAPQLEALSADTDVVTLTIGGNDLGFFDVVSSCIALSPLGPLALPYLADPSQNVPDCASTYTAGGFDALGARLQAVVLPALSQTLAAVAEKAPNARVFVLDYPSLTPSAADVPETGCFRSVLPANPLDPTAPLPTNGFPFTVVDTSYLHGVQGLLSATIAGAAAAGGASYVPVFPGTSSHSACATGDEAYVEGITLTGVAGGITATPASLHPTVAGTEYTAELVASSISAAFPAPQPTATPTATPTASPEPTATPTATPTAAPQPTGTASPQPTETAAPAPAPSASSSPTSSAPAPLGISRSTPSGSGSGLAGTGFWELPFLIGTGALLIVAGVLVVLSRRASQRQGH